MSNGTLSGLEYSLSCQNACISDPGTRHFSCHNSRLYTFWSDFELKEMTQCNSRNNETRTATSPDSNLYSLKLSKQFNDCAR